MRRKIIVPVDFSPCSLHAAGYAFRFARAIGADVELFNRCNPNSRSLVLKNDDPLSGDDSGSQATLLHRLEGLASSLSRTLPCSASAAKPLPVVSCSLSQGLLCEEITARNSSAEHAVAVVGLSRKNGIFSVKLEPDLIQFIRKSSIPVICVPEDYNFSVPKKIAFASDLDFADIPLIKAFSSISRVLDADLLLLHADLGKASKVKQVHFSDFLRQAAQEMNFSRITSRSIISRHLTPALQYAINGGEIEILAMTYHSRGGLSRLFSKDHISPLLRTTRIPLLFFHAPQDVKEL